MRLNIPVRVDITRPVLLHACSLNLLEAPLRKIDISSPEVATQHRMPKPECRGEGANSASIPRRCIVNNFDSPVIFVISDSEITIAGHFVLRFRDWCRNGMGV